MKQATTSRARSRLRRSGTAPRWKPDPLPDDPSQWPAVMESGYVPIELLATLIERKALEIFAHDLKLCRTHVRWLKGPMASSRQSVPRGLSTAGLWLAGMARRDALDPLPEHPGDWPQYILAAHLPPRTINALLADKRLKLWRHDSQGRLWLKRLEPNDTYSHEDEDY